MAFIYLCAITLLVPNLAVVGQGLTEREVSFFECMLRDAAMRVCFIGPACVLL